MQGIPLAHPSQAVQASGVWLPAAAADAVHPCGHPDARRVQVWAALLREQGKPPALEACFTHELCAGAPGAAVLLCTVQAHN